MPSIMNWCINLLPTYVTNAQELGDEPLVIMTCTGSLFDLSQNNPSDMVVLAEIVGIYKQAAEQYKVLYKEEEKHIYLMVLVA